MSMDRDHVTFHTLLRKTQVFASPAFKSVEHWQKWYREIENVNRDDVLDRSKIKPLYVFHERTPLGSKNMVYLLQMA